MKAWWRIYDKPRGRWRPLLEFGIALTSEIHEIDELNIDTDFVFFFHGSNIEECCREKITNNNTLQLPQEIYREDAKAHQSAGTISSCFCSEKEWYLRGRKNIRELRFTFRLPWRPGARPDYSDFIDPVRDFLRRTMDEIECRFQVARESAPSDEWMLEEEFDSFSWQTTQEGLEVAERKLRVIRK